MRTPGIFVFGLMIGAAMCFASGVTLCVLHVCQGDAIPSIVFTGGVGCLSAIGGFAHGAMQQKQEPAVKGE